MTTLPSNLPDELIARRQWVIWRYIQRRGKDRPDKVPHSTMGYRADVTNPATWSAFELALKAAERPHFAEGIGFVFSSNDPYSGIDMDNSWQSNADEGAP